MLNLLSALLLSSTLEPKGAISLLFLNFVVDEAWINSWLAQEILVSLEEVCFMDLISLNACRTM